MRLKVLTGALDRGAASRGGLACARLPYGPGPLVRSTGKRTRPGSLVLAPLLKTALEVQHRLASPGGRRRPCARSSGHAKVEAGGKLPCGGGSRHGRGRWQTGREGQAALRGKAEGRR